MNPPNIRSLLDIAEGTDDTGVFNSTIRALSDHAAEWPSLRESVFALVASEGMKPDFETVHRCADSCRMDVLLRSAGDNHAIVEAACTVVLTLTTWGEDWFGEPEMEGWTNATYNLDSLRCGSQALPLLVERLGLVGESTDHLLTLACIKRWVDFWIEAETDPHARGERDALATLGWTRERFREVSAATQAVLAEERFDDVIQAGLDANHRDCVIARYLREDLPFDWFVWKARLRLQQGSKAVFGGRVVVIDEDDDIRWILRYFGQPHILTTLWCADPELYRRIINVMALRASVMTEEDVALLTPPDESALEAAWEALARTVEGLIGEGRLRLCDGAISIREAMESR